MKKSHQQRIILTPIYLDIALPVPLRRSFQYSLPSDLRASDLIPGMRIKVPFGRQKMIGILLDVTHECRYLPEKIKPILELLDTESVFHPNIFTICRWASSYYQHPIGEVFLSALPVLLRQGESAEQTLEYLVRQGGETNTETLNRSPRQRALLSKIEGIKPGLTRHDLTKDDFGASIINGLIRKGLANWTSIEQKIEPFDRNKTKNEEALSLNQEQINTMKSVSETGPHLVFGITGSGKTEIYLQAIAGVISAGKQALVLVPEIGLTPQTVERFRARFNAPVFVLHSGLSDRDRLEVWRQSRDGGAAVIIGTRSAIFTPLQNPGIIIIDEEHDASFKQQEGFRYSARDIAVLRGQLESIPVILGSATPSLETYNNAKKGKYSLSLLRERPLAAKDTQYKLISTQHEQLKQGFSRELISHIKKHLDTGNQVLIFINRRGFSPVILCRDCGWIAECHRCDARMTYHLSMNRLICHHCGTQNKVNRQCASCHSNDLVPLGQGTQRIEQTLNTLFPAKNVIRIDRDSTRKKGSLEQMMSDIKQGEPALLVGTQLLAKGHHFPDVTLVAILDIDSGFYSADYRAIERMGQLLLQVGGRAGRESKPGTVVIQTQFPDQPILNTLISKGYETFCEQLLAERKQYQLPPFSYQAVIRAEANSSGRAMQFLSELLLAKKGKENDMARVSILGPVPSSMEKRAGKHRAQLLFSAPDRKSLQAGLLKSINIAENSELGRKVRWNVDVDPIDLF